MQRDPAIPFFASASALEHNMFNMLHSIRLDYVSCVLTILGTILLGKRLWQGWVVAAVNSAVVCVIGVRTAQFGFVPANLLTWRFRSHCDHSEEDAIADSQ